MIAISDKALDMLKHQGADEGIVRITVKSGGCAGMTYDAVIVGTMDPNDQLVWQNGDVQVVSDPSSLPYLEGLEVDYSDDLISAGFRFSNSSNESSCGCGASFTVSGFPQFINQGAGCGS